MGLPLLGFIYPVAVEGLVNSDLLMGHGTFVAGVIAGTGAASGGYYGGMAPGAKLLGSLLRRREPLLRAVRDRLHPFKSRQPKTFASSIAASA